MKKLIIASMIMASVNAFAQDIELPAPDFKQKSLSMIETLQTRHSVRNFAEIPLTVQQISNVCWAACGQSRDDEHITAPSALNRQEIRLFVFSTEGVYEYLAKENILKQAAKGDYRQLVAGPQDFVMQAPVSFVMVIDFDKLAIEDEARALMMGCVDAGNVSENINLYCQSVGLATVPRATMDVDGIRKLLNLSERHLPVMNNPVGVEKKI